MKKRLLAPSFSGIDTFWRAPISTPEEVPSGYVVVVGVPNEATLSTRTGTRFGPKAIRQHSSHFIAQTYATPAREYISVATGKKTRIPDEIQLVDAGDVTVYPNDLTRTAVSITDTLQVIVQRGAFPVSLGGDHYITFPVVRGVFDGLRNTRGHTRFGYIQIDSHLDAGGENLVWGRHWHGSNARLIAELPGVSQRNIAWVGINGLTWSDEWEFARGNGATIITRPDIGTIGIRKAVEQALNIAAEGTDAVYVSVDLDVVDVSLSPGVGSVNFGGITPSELLEAAEMLGAGPICGLDVVELCPPLDPSGVTGRLAAATLMSLLAPRLFDGSSS
jgi:agmatinase